MYEVLKRLYQRHFTNPEAVILALVLLVGFILLLTFGNILASVLVALVVAFVLEWVIKQVESLQVPRPWAIGIVYLGFLSVLIVSLFVLLPMLWQQMALLFEEMPRMLSYWQVQLLLLPERYPELISQAQVTDFIASARSQITSLGQTVLTYSVSVIPIVVAVVVYCILVPLMVFFMLKDRDKIAQWTASFLPSDRGLVERVWTEVHDQLGNFVRGKAGEIIIVGGISYIVFLMLGLNYAMLMGALVGLSVLVPYVGATVVTIPLAIVGYFQWGWDMQFGYLMLAYAIIQAFDGNVLVPFLFSEAVNLHPLAIIIAIIFFGGLWGFWGMFFAIPLAILIKAVINAWPEPKDS